jgi:hypothetical protein
MSYIQMILSLRLSMVSIPSIKDNTCFQLKPNVKFQYIIVVYIGTEAGNEHYSHIEIDILKGTCGIMDPHADSQMDCIYFEVCNCKGSGVADIV